MPSKPRPDKFAEIVTGVRQLTGLLDAICDRLDEDEVEQLSCLVLTGLWRRSGLDRETFHDSVQAALLGLKSAHPGARKFARCVATGDRDVPQKSARRAVAVRRY